MAKVTAPNFAVNVNGIGLSAIANVSDVNFAGALMLLTFEDGGINAYPAMRSVAIMDGTSFSVFIPAAGHVADIEVEGDTLSRVSAHTAGTLLNSAAGWCFFGDAVNFEVMSDNGMFDIEPAEDEEAEIESEGEEGDDETDYGEGDEGEEEIETPPARRGRPAATPTRKQAEPEKRGRGRPRLSDEEKAERAAVREAEAAAEAAKAKRQAAKAAPAAPVRKAGIARPVAKSGFSRR